MSFSSLHKLVTYLLAGIGLLSLGLGGVGPLALVAVVVFVASVFAEGPRLATPRWRRGWTAATLLVLAAIVAWAWIDGAYFDCAVWFAAFVQLNRLCNRRNAREYQQIAVLSFVHLLAATALSVDLTYAVCFFAFVVVAPWVLALTHLRREIEGNYPASVAGRPAADVARVLASRRVVGGSFLVATAAIGIPLFFLTASVFLLFPRVGLGMLTFGRHSPRQTAGFSDRVELGGFGVIRDDPTVVLRVVPPGLGPRPPANAALRLRGTAFDHYDGRRWRRTLPTPEILPVANGLYALRGWPERTDPVWSFVLDPLDEPVLFLPPDAVAIRVPPRTEGGYPANRVVRRALDEELRYGGQEELPLPYEVYTRRDPEAPGRPAPLDANELQRYLQLPSRHEHVAALARTLTADARTALEKANAIERHLLRFRYTTELPHVRPGEPPLDAFLFRARAGHCEYFATAMVVMLREVGIPSRNVTGFLGGRYNEYGRYYAIRQGDAHSWVELWDGHRWVVRDPTPPLRGELGPEDTLFSGLDAILDALRTEWRRSVVGYDLTTQVGVFEDLRRALEAMSLGLSFRRGVDGAGRARTSGLSAVAPWLVAAVVVVLAAAAALLLLRRRRQAARRDPPPPRGQREAAGLYRELEAALERHGFPRAPSTTPLELVAQLERARFAGAEVARDVTHAYLGARFGARTIAAEERSRLRARIRELRRSAQA